MVQLVHDEPGSGKSLNLPYEYAELLSRVPTGRVVLDCTHWGEVPARDPEVAQAPEPAEPQSQEELAEVKPKRRHRWRRHG